MNLIYTLTWRDTGAEQRAREIYLQIRDAVARGARFPFDCPYEVGLVRWRGPAVGEWQVNVLALRGQVLDERARAETEQRIEAWLQAAGAVEAIGGTTRTAYHLKLASELGPSYEVVSSFGTFVGEPDPEIAGKADLKVEEAPLVIEKSEPKKTLAEMAQALSEPSLEAQQARAAVTTPPPALTRPENQPASLPPITVPSVAPAVERPPSAQGTLGLTCLGAALIGLGSIIGLTGIAMGLLFGFGAFAVEPVETNIGEFLLVLACCPLPVLILGVILAVAGIVMVWKLKTAAPAPR